MCSLLGTKCNVRSATRCNTLPLGAAAEWQPAEWIDSQVYNGIASSKHYQATTQPDILHPGHQFMLNHSNVVYAISQLIDLFSLRCYHHPPHSLHATDYSSRYFLCRRRAVLLSPRTRGSRFYVYVQSDARNAYRAQQQTH